MSELGSVSVWIERLQVGDREAAQQLWERYFHSMIGLARVGLRALPRTSADEEDVALSAFDSFYRRAEQGKFPRLADRHDLWAMLATITARKASDLRKREAAAKRDHHRTVHEGDFAADGPEDVPLLVRLAGREPDAAFAAQMADQCRHLLAGLGDDELRAIALMKLEGHTNEEIATHLDCALSTVERRLKLVRSLWWQADQG